MNILIAFLIVIQIVCQILIDREGTFIADPLLKAIQGHSLFTQNFQSETILYPGHWADPDYSGFIFNGVFSKFVNGKYIGQYPVLFSFFSGFIIKIGIQSIPIFASLFYFFSFRFLKKAAGIPASFCFLYFFSSILIATLYDLNESSLFFFLCSTGFSFFVFHLNNPKNTWLFTGFFLLSVAAWLRLESILFIASCFFGLLIVAIRRKESVKLGSFLVIALSVLPVFLFFSWNIYSYSHFLGPRYFFNFDQKLTLSERLLRIVSMSLFNKTDSGYKFGLFFCSPYLLLSLIYLTRKYRDLSSVALFACLVFISQFIMVSLSAPNDGATFTARYHLLEIIPGLIISYEFYRPEKKKYLAVMEKISYSFAILFGIFISIGWIFFARELKNVQVTAMEGNPDTLLVKSEVLCGSLGLEHLRKSIFCLRTEEQEKRILTRILENPSIKRITYILENRTNNDEEKNLIDTVTRGRFMLEKRNKYRISSYLIFVRREANKNESSAGHGPD